MKVYFISDNIYMLMELPLVAQSYSIFFPGLIFKEHDIAFIPSSYAPINVKPPGGAGHGVGI